jgi:K+-transporting ATPase ATPase C chain
MKFSSIVRQHWAALRALAVLTVIVGVEYPLAIWLIALLPGLSEKANGSIVHVAGKPVGSSLIGQLFTDGDGNPLPQYFQSRPSAAGDGYDPLASGASNLRRASSTHRINRACSPRCAPAAPTSVRAMGSTAPARSAPAVASARCSR